MSSVFRPASQLHRWIDGSPQACRRWAESSTCSLVSRVSPSLIAPLLPWAMMCSSFVLNPLAFLLSSSSLISSRGFAGSHVMASKLFWFSHSTSLAFGHAATSRLIRFSLMLFGLLSGRPWCVAFFGPCLGCCKHRGAFAPPPVVTAVHPRVRASTFKVFYCI